MTNEEEIIKKIESNELRIKPRYYFILLASFWAMLASTLLAISIFFFSFIFHLLRTSDISLLPTFGTRGFWAFLAVFPWFLLLLILLSVVVAGWILDHYAFVYRKPLLYLMLSLIIIIGLPAAIIQAISFHEKFSAYSQENRLPIVRHFYEMYRDPAGGRIIRGVITDMQPQIWHIQAGNNQTFSVSINKDTQLYGDNQIEPGQNIMIFGNKTDGSVEAFNIRRIIWQPELIPNLVP